MGHNYVKEEETFNITRNGTVPKPIAADILAGHVLKADGTWGEGGGGGTVTDVQVDHQSVVDEDGVAQIPAIPQVPVQDVEVNGQSVVDQNGIAQIPAIPDDLNDLSDVSVSSPTNGQVLKYNSTTQKFENANESGGGGGGNVDDVQVNGTSVVDTNKVAKITSYKEVTRAQYNALPDSKYNDGVMYCITDSPNDPYQFPPLIYSSEEREIGVFVDGKPVYELTVHNNSLAPEVNVETNIADLSSYNIDIVVSIQSTDHMQRSAGNINRWMPNASYFEPFYDPVSKYLKFRQSYAGSATNDMYITIQYTKTTDIAGSGTWNQQGALAHHYSTDEKIVGTWYNGKTIYEKVYIFSSGMSISTANWTQPSPAIDSSNIEDVIGVTCLHSDGTCYNYCAADPTRDGHTHLGFKCGDGGTASKAIVQYTKITD